MTRIYLADASPKECSVLRSLLLDLKMEVVGESSDWFTALVEIPTKRVDMLLVDWDLIPINAPDVAINGLQKTCPSLLVIVLISNVDVYSQAAILAGADAFVSKDDVPDRVAERLRAVAAGIFRS